MARFQIFIPKSEQVPLDNLQTQQPLAAVGLSDLLTNSAGQLSGGPEDQIGILISWPNAPGSAVTGYKPMQQTWIPAAASGDLEARRYWVGIWNDRPPTPADLKKHRQHPGRPVVLDDWQEWVIPSAAGFPNYATLKEDGNWVFVVDEGFNELFEGATKWLHILDNLEGGDRFNRSDAITFIVNNLKLNYMLTDELVSEMKLFSTQSILKSLIAICEVESYV